MAAGPGSDDACGEHAQPHRIEEAGFARLSAVASQKRRRDGRVAEGARLESVFRGNSNVGSNPTLSASPCIFLYFADVHTTIHTTFWCGGWYPRYNKLKHQERPKGPPTDAEAHGG